MTETIFMWAVIVLMISIFFAIIGLTLIVMDRASLLRQDIHLNGRVVFGCMQDIKQSIE